MQALVLFVVLAAYHVEENGFQLILEIYDLRPGITLYYVETIHAE